jgi:hypothetical protein
MLFTLNIRETRWLLAGVATLSLAFAGACKKDDSGGDKAGAKGETEMVALSKDGTELDPAVPKARIPDGSWMCDMGTVHYARTEKGDGVCPLCGMPLTQKGAAAEPAAAVSDPVPADSPAAGTDAAPEVKEPADSVDPAEARKTLQKMSDEARTYYAGPDTTGTK